MLAFLRLLGIIIIAPCMSPLHLPGEGGEVLAFLRLQGIIITITR